MADARDPAQTTGYALNTRRGGAGADAGDDWAPPVRELVARDYAFLPLGYAPPGCLFRGIDGGLAAALAAGHFGLNAGAHALAALEREAGVMFLSQDLSDALSVARPWAGPGDVAVLVVPAAVFAARAAAGEAAVLGFADPGVVFRYPFVTAPLELGELAAIACAEPLSPQATATAAGRPAFIRIEAAGGRGECERRLAAALAARGYVAATATPVARVPRALGR
ncbi:MAG: hypothetical protein ACU85V_16100 [Gammaproteobacteria bacterium]